MKKQLAILLSFLLVMLAMPALAEQTTFALKKENNRVFVGETVQMALTRSGEAAEGDVTFTSSNERCATVDANGLVTGVSKGQTTITARLQKDKRVFKTSLTVTVAVKAEEISVTENTLPIYAPADAFVAPLLQQETELPVLVLRMGSNQGIKATALPTNANDRVVTLSSTDESIVRVQGSTLYPKKSGECDLTIASRQNPEVIRQLSLIHI